MRNFVLFFFMTVFIYFYSYTIGGETSMLMFYMFLFAPMVSILLTLPVRNKLDVFIVTPSSEVEKGGLVKVSVTIENKSFIPLPFVEITFCQAANFHIPDSPKRVISLGPYQKKVITMEYTAKTRGIGKIGVDSILLRDYLCLFKVSLLKNSDDYDCIGEVAVMPRLISIKPNSKILQGSSMALQHDDSGISSTGVYSWNGEPGYEFREYMGGDPLHKVHWKLSARNDKLMVRKDEGRGVSKKRLVLDPYVKSLQRKQAWKNLSLLILLSSKKSYVGNTDDEVLVLEEKVLEALLAVADMTIKAGREVELWLYEDKKWIKYAITDRKSINELQHRLASYEFLRNLADSPCRLPLADIMEQEGKSRYAQGGESTVFTCHLDEKLLEESESFSDYGMMVDAVYIKNTTEDRKTAGKGEEEITTRHQGNVWVLGPDDDIVEAFS